MLNQGPQTLACTGCAQLFEGDGEHNYRIKVAVRRFVSIAQNSIWGISSNRPHISHTLTAS